MPTVAVPPREATVSSRGGELIGEVPPSPAGPIGEDEAATLPLPPEVGLPRALQVMRFSVSQIEFVFGGRRHA